MAKTFLTPASARSRHLSDCVEYRYKYRYAARPCKCQ